jgi:hypothetical protein
MELSGKIFRVLALQQGEGKNGAWKKQEYVIEIPGQVVRKVCFSLWGDKVDQFRLKEGDEATVSFDLESREFNGRWYTDVKAWKITSKQTTSNSIEDIQSEPMMEIPSADDLPF